MSEVHFEPNSHKYKDEMQKANPEKPRMEKVIKGTVKTKKKSEASKLKDALLVEDAATIKTYLLTDVLLPALKNTIEDVVTNGIRMLLRGDTTARKSNGPSKISYNRMYDRRDDERRPSMNYRSRSAYDYDDIILETRGEAEAVIDRLSEAIDTYGQASIGDLNDLVGRTGNYTDNDYGWYNLRNAEAIRTRDGYVLKLPRALPLK